MASPTASENKGHGPLRASGFTNSLNSQAAELDGDPKTIHFACSRVPPSRPKEATDRKDTVS